MKMQAIEIQNPGKHGSLHVVSRPRPKPGKGEILIHVAASGINRADIFQLQGLYPPPPGASDIPGMEVSGTITAMGEDVTGLHTGMQVCALLEGGGYAEYAVASAALTLPVPANVPLIHAAALPEACFTVWKNLFLLGKLHPEENVLIHAGASGIGTTAIQIASALGSNVIATASTPEKQEICKSLGAIATCTYEDDYREVLQNTLPKAKGLDVILDSLGTPYLQKNLECLNYKGRLIVIALLNGSKGEIAMGSVLLKNLSIVGSTLRSSSKEEKAFISHEVIKNLWPLYAHGRVMPVVDSTFPASDASLAFQRMQERHHTGKILLKW